MLSQRALLTVALTTAAGCCASQLLILYALMINKIAHSASTAVFYPLKKSPHYISSERLYGLAK